MVGQMATSSDRARTYWTPIMERHFIDLMIEQMDRGTRIGHTFNKQAWTDMLNMFNAKFGSQYDKDVLKSRYTNLWKQFNDVKNLLAQNGFSWDETRQMVVADDSIWDAYIKTNPDARSYKTKVVLNFNELCKIYSYTCADGRYSRSSHDVEFDDDMQGVNIGDGMCSLPPSSNERPRTDWTLEMDNFFIELMLDHVGSGNQTGNTFNKQAWTDMLALFNAKFGPQHSKRVLRHRYKKLWKYNSDINFILKQDGFSWDEAQNMIAADDNIWDAYTKTHPHARTYRTKALPNYHDLGLIFGNKIEDGLDGNLHQEKDLEKDMSQTTAGKGRQIFSVSDRTRTYWTPPMDRYFIDLLLDQVHRGNKLGQTFISQAWIDMVTSFNTQFKSCHDKEVLKNRYKHLRRQYNDIKNLLEHSEFSWDETREMIVAEDHVWDAYTKEHPDIRPYRVKTIPGYYKLCVIFGEESSDGRYSRLARNADPISEEPLLMIGEEKNDQSPVDVIPLRMEWTPQMEHYFIDLMLEQVQEGNKTSHTFNEQAWAHMLDSFSRRFGLECEKQALEDRYVCLKKQCHDINNLLNVDGFTWDGTQQMIMADDDVWEAYSKEHPDALSYRNICLSGYSDLSKICQNDVLDGRSSMERGNDGYFAEDIQMSEQQKRRPTTTSIDSKQPRKAQKTDEDMQNALSEMAGVVKELVSKKEKKNCHSIESAIDALQAIPDIDDDLLLDACDLLEDERKAKTFLALDVTLRKKWLLRKLRP
ncbi:hypothetical protein UlMin_034458 [Ulmus minor]